MTADVQRSFMPKRLTRPGSGRTGATARFFTPALLNQETGQPLRCIRIAGTGAGAQLVEVTVRGQ